MSLPIIYKNSTERDFSVCVSCWEGFSAASGLCAHSRVCSIPHTRWLQVCFPLRPHPPPGKGQSFVSPAPSLTPDILKALKKSFSTELQIADEETQVPRSLFIWATQVLGPRQDAHPGLPASHSCLIPTFGSKPSQKPQASCLHRPPTPTLSHPICYF